MPDRAGRGDIDIGAIGRRVLHRREQRGLKQQEVARRAGLSEAYVNRVENGLVANPKVKDLAAVARALAIPLDALLYGGEVPQTEQEALVILARHPELSRILANLIRGLQLASLEDREYLVGQLELMSRRFGAVPPVDGTWDQVERRLALLRLFDPPAPDASVERVLARAAEEATVVVPCDIGASYRWNADQEALEVVGSTLPVPPETQRLVCGQGIGGQAFAQRATVAADDYQREAAALGVPPLGIHAAAATPIVLEDRPVGVLTVLRFRTTDPFSAEDLATLERLAQLTAATIGARKPGATATEARREP